MHRFRGEEGLIKSEAKEAVEDFIKSVGRIDPHSEEAFFILERLSLSKIDQFKALSDRLQHMVVEEFDKELIALSNKSTIPFESMKPDFTDETFRQIRESTESKAQETRSYEEGKTFKKTHTYSVYVQDKHFEIIKNDILIRLDEIKNNLTSNLEDFVEKIRSRYINELAYNARTKKSELDAIMEAKITAEQNLSIIQNLSDQAERISAAKATANKIKGGIAKNV